MVCTAPLTLYRNWLTVWSNGNILQYGESDVLARFYQHSVLQEDPVPAVWGRLVDWCRGYGATTPSHLGRKLAGPLCTTLSSAHQPQRRSTSSDMSPLVARNGNGWEMADKFRLKIRIPRNFQGSLTCRKSATWDRRLYFPSKGRHTEDFFARKNRQLRPGLNPRSWVPEASTLTTRPPKPLSSVRTHLTQSIIWSTKTKQEDMSMWVSGSEHGAIWWPLCIEHCSMALSLNEVLKWCNRGACKDVPYEDLPIMTCTKQNVCVKRVRFQDKHLILVTSQNLYQHTCNSNQPP